MAELKEALSSIDQYGRRLEIIPAEVRGKFRRWRNWTQWLLLMIFLVLPWTEVRGLQTVLIDIVHRQFVFFGIQFWSHDGPLIFFLLAILTLSLAFMTALWGRVWCGWACPQTVFIDAVYRRIERWVEGNYLARRQLRQSPWNAHRIGKWLAKWALFLLVSSIIAHSFVAYLAGANELMSMLKGSPAENWNYFLLTSVMTAILLFNFGWFREQFCIVMCPYGRFQSVLMDSNSVTVLYDQSRGEPRKNTPSPTGKQGDCVACNRCVQVCPTGIDIRKGIQMECIACTACIDACDEIMEKVKKPTGLIRYASLWPSTRFFRPRILIYGTLLLLSIGALGYNFLNRSPYLVTVLRALETPYQKIRTPEGDRILNHFRLHVHNQTKFPQVFLVRLTAEEAQQGFQLTIPNGKVEVDGLKSKELHFFVLFPEDVLKKKGSSRLEIQVVNSDANFSESKSLEIVGPLKSN